MKAKHLEQAADALKTCKEKLNEIQNYKTDESS